MSITIEQLTEILDARDERQIERFKKLLEKPKAYRINQKTAGELYGKANIKNWRNNGQLVAHKMGCAIEYDVRTLDILMEQRQLIIKH